MFIESKHFIAGFTASQAGLEKAANPLLMDAQPFAMWNLGHDYGELIKHEVSLNAEPLQEVEKSAVKQGEVAYAKGLKLIDNPYGFGDPFGTVEEQATHEARRDWISGWHNARAKAEQPTPSQDPDHKPTQTTALEFQRFGRAYRDIKPRMVPIIDQNGKQVGSGTIDIMQVDAYVDDRGTAWLPPTAWAYYAVCLALRRAEVALSSSANKSDPDRA